MLKSLDAENDRRLLDELASRYLDGAHAIFAPSGSAMWLTCSGSLIANLLAPDDAGEDAAWGTVAHDITEYTLKWGALPEHRLGETVTITNAGIDYLIVIDEAMMQYVLDNVRWVEDIPGERYVEKRVYFSEYTPLPRQGGTADLIIINGTHLVICDWKYGKGQIVYAEENSQAKLYALGVLLLFWDVGIKTIEIRIGQPRIEHFDIWHTTADALMKWATEVVRPAADAAWKLDAPRTPSIKGCRWCKVRGECDVAAKVAKTTALRKFIELDDETPPGRGAAWDANRPIGEEEILNRVSRMATEDIAETLTWRKISDQIFHAMQIELVQRLDRGEESKMWKLARARSKQQWRDERQAEQELLALGAEPEDLIISKFLSPNQMLDVMKGLGVPRSVAKKFLARLVHKPVGQKTLVPVSDPRPALLGDVAKMLRDDNEWDDL